MNWYMILGLSTFNALKIPKNRVIHEVIHVIHKNTSFFERIKIQKNEQLFCEDIINFAKNRKKTKK